MNIDDFHSKFSIFFDVDFLRTTESTLQPDRPFSHGCNRYTYIIRITIGIGVLWPSLGFPYRARLFRYSQQCQSAREVPRKASGIHGRQAIWRLIGWERSPNPLRSRLKVAMGVGRHFSSPSPYGLMRYYTVIGGIPPPPPYEEGPDVIGGYYDWANRRALIWVTDCKSRTTPFYSR